MTDWASSGGVKIERAKQHVNDLEIKISAFLERHPYVIVREINAEPGYLPFAIYRVGVREDPDPQWGAIAGEILHDLRSSLNILWRAVWHPPSRPADEGSDEFPFYGDAQKFEARFAKLGRSKKPAKQALMDLLRVIKPYKGGNDVLGLLVYANDLDKHRLLIPAYTQIERMITRVGTTLWWAAHVPPMYATWAWEKPICPVEDGTIVFIGPVAEPGHVDVDPQVSLDITFGEGEAIKGKPLVPTLHKMTEMVESIAESFLRAPILGAADLGTAHRGRSRHAPG